MASLNGVSSSNTTSSLYNSANIVSGLASGLDTEGMIENLVKSYQTKIDTLNQKVTKTEWKQDAYRSIISKLVGFNSKYTSYTSSTNLMSSSFFNSAVKVETLGEFKDLVSASGKTSSSISLDAVRQLATSAQYRTAGQMKAGDGTSIQAEEALDLNGKTTLGALKGSMSIAYGSNTLSISFDEVADVKAMDEIRSKLEAEGKSATDADVLAGLISQKLEGQQISFTGGKVDTAENRVKVSVNNGVISLSDKSTGGNKVYITSASDSVKSALGLNLDNAKEDQVASFQVGGSLTREVDNAEYLSGKLMNLSLDGSTKQIKLPTIVSKDGDYRIMDADGKSLAYTAENYTKVLNESLNKAFKGKVNVENTAEDGGLQLRFQVQEGSELVINTDVGETLGIGRTSTTYLNTSKTLGELLEGKMDDPDFLSGLTKATKKDKNGNVLRDSKGNIVYDLDEKGEQKYEFKINDVVIGSYSKNSKLSDVMSDINSNDEAGVRVSYSQTTKNFLFSAKETGADSEIKMGSGLAQAMFGSTEGKDLSSSRFVEAYGSDWLRDGESLNFSFELPKGTASVSVTKDTTIQEVIDSLNSSLGGMNNEFSYNKYSGQIEARDKATGAKVEMSIKDPYDRDVEFDESKGPEIDYTPGQDAEFTVTVNGETINMKRSSNSVNIDGLTINMKDTFDGAVDKEGKPTVDSTGRPMNAVTFNSTVDADKIVDAVKGMLEDYNTMMAEIKSAYSTMPYQTSSGSFANYEPLTEDDRAGMSESAIERYEEKAKQGILFGDRNLSALYNKLRNAFSPAGDDGAFLRAMGFSTSYSISDGTQAVTLDEDKLRAMLESDPDKVTEVFTKTDGLGGVMQNVKNTLDTYARTTGEPKGILIQQAGSPLSSLSLMSNSWQKEIDNLNTQIETWQDKLSDQVDRYTQQFSRLEVLINQMNSQSSTLAGLMGG
ncbi:MAG: flagellar filament capping protein FliD [Lawsonibacter sp.]|nr:flagellar filament capping protein FliD [Lawsonibacter sp.]